jgi:hypothetical protein
LLNLQQHGDHAIPTLSFQFNGENYRTITDRSVKCLGDKHKHIMYSICVTVFLKLYSHDEDGESLRLWAANNIVGMCIGGNNAQEWITTSHSLLASLKMQTSERE